jgi:hypothetical protein
MSKHKKFKLFNDILDTPMSIGVNIKRFKELMDEYNI